MGEALEGFVTRLHLDPRTGSSTRRTPERRASSGRPQGARSGTFYYAGLEGLEGVGLLLRKRWAGYLTVVATGLLLPVAVYEIARKPSALRIVVLLGNLAILVYLIVKLVQGQDLGVKSPRKNPFDSLSIGGGTMRGCSEEEIWEFWVKIVRDMGSPA